MAGMNASFADSILALLLQGTGITGLAINATSSPLTVLYLSLHTADPTSGNQSTSEVAYTGYARTAISRTSSGWTLASNVATFAAAINFPACTGGSATATYAGLGTASSGTGVLMLGGALSPSIAISSGVTPQLTTSTTWTIT